MSSLYLNADLHPDAFTVGARLPIWGADARHAAQVARVRTGERIGVGDGKGRLAWGRVVHVAQGEVAIEAEEIVLEERTGPRIVLVQALAKGDRDELAIQAATELGVHAVVPWQAARSVSVWKGDKVEKGLERWRSVVREASKQAIRPSVPEVRPLVSTKELAAHLRGSSSGEAAYRDSAILVLEPTALVSLVSIRPSDYSTRESVILVVGPEGGIAPEELRELELAGAQLVRLGPEVLRTSTAGPAAIAALAVLLGRW
ncbi:MAG TPA: 16S rRNA (uracil(1498)-N(3))-methyltransferase [Microbacteriaceae bacterium]|nr:16S rRNA (uracil(1498)-N(3))-methyltransferase [Microbacteriaceae bacterium]